MVAPSPRTWSARTVRPAACTLAFATLVVAVRPAAAENRLSLDASAAFPSNEVDDNGWGIGARFGHRWGLPLLNLTPELGLAYHQFGGPYDPATFSVFGGGRVGIGFIIEPSVFAHAGVGHLDRASRSRTSLGYDVGAALDLTVFPVAFGPHVMLAGIAGDSDSDGYSWVSLGGHLTISLGDEDD